MAHRATQHPRPPTPRPAQERFSQEIEDWINRQRKISYETRVLSHGIHDEYIVDLINVKNECPLEWLPAGVEDDIGAVISATLNLDVPTSALLTMKGDMAHIGTSSRI
jgi:hypothetical protein